MASGFSGYEQRSVVLLKAAFMSLSDPQVSVTSPHPRAGFAKAGAEGDGH